MGSANLNQILGRKEVSSPRVSDIYRWISLTTIIRLSGHILVYMLHWSCAIHQKLYCCYIVDVSFRDLRDFSSRSCLLEVSDFWGFETRSRSRWFSKTETGPGIGLVDSQKPRLDSVSVSLILKNWDWTRYRFHSTIMVSQFGKIVAVVAGILRTKALLSLDFKWLSSLSITNVHT